MSGSAAEPGSGGVPGDGAPPAPGPVTPLSGRPVALNLRPVVSTALLFVMHRRRRRQRKRRRLVSSMSEAVTPEPRPPVYDAFSKNMETIQHQRSLSDLAWLSLYRYPKQVLDALTIVLKPSIQGPNTIPAQLSLMVLFSHLGGLNCSQAASLARLGVSSGTRVISRCAQAICSKLGGREQRSPGARFSA